MELYSLKPNELPYMEFSKLALRCYTNEEIVKLSVVEITQTETFDKAGFPIRGGLYDPLLGPTEGKDDCETCGLVQKCCPGHYGHVKLSLPVFNPFLYQIIYEIMKGTCYFCNRFIGKSTAPAAKLLIFQLSCIENDLIVAAEQLQAELDKIVEVYQEKSKSMTPFDEENVMSQLTKILQKVIDENKMGAKSGGRLTKNSVKLRDTLVKEFLKNILLKRKAKCPHCKHKLPTVRDDNHNVILLDFAGRSQDKAEAKTIAKKVVDNGDGLITVETGANKAELKTTGMLNKSLLNESMNVTENFLDKQLNQVTSGRCDKLAWRAREVREHFRRLWKNEMHIIPHLFPMFKSAAHMQYPLDILFTDHVLIPPTKFRPLRAFGGAKYESPATLNFRLLMEADKVLKILHYYGKDLNNAPIEALKILEGRAFGSSTSEKIYNGYINLQMRMNALYDQANGPRGNDIPGIRQVLEKKEGLFRMNMMGKRVNYACRSVITPDPYLDVDEIGIPEIFARKLTFAEPFSMYNENRMRKLVRAGTHAYPGANYVQRLGRPKELLISDAQRKVASKLMSFSEEEIDRQALVVYRHLKRGDMLLMNRQPTLHRPSIMGHKARILKHQKALRMNYAPCKAYNADFDGDEMNGHFVQSQMAQTEAQELVAVGQNYLVPKDGTPILGLIQDHVVSGVFMTMRGRFFTKEDFMYLLLAAFGIPEKRLKLPRPAMIKPKMLYSGKQLISAILLNAIPEGKAQINLSAKAKTPVKCWTVRGFSTPEFDTSESNVIFRNGELLVGVLDKSHYGATQFGLIHCCFELYGSKIAVQILSCFSRLFTRYLQWHGFTLGVADILVTKNADKIRRKAIKAIRAIGPDTVKKAFNLPEDATPLRMKHAMNVAYNNPQKNLADAKVLDFTVKQMVSKHVDEINNSCVPEGLIRTFPDNSLQMMIQSGAKGSLVNAIQISCALGQIELEGQRPPLSAVGRTLPSFKCFDPSPRAGGFVDQRFLTGINPQELFFHTMAGREGLIDTAVKTSRSGYLQRCIIKHLEGMVVNYDQTVRDHDGTVVQFRYGEDGMEIAKSTFMNKSRFPFLEENQTAIRTICRPKGVRDSEWKVAEAASHYKKIRKFRRKSTNTKIRTGGFLEFSQLEENRIPLDAKLDERANLRRQLNRKWANLSNDEKAAVTRKYPDSVDVVYSPAHTLGALPEKILDQIHDYMKEKDSSENFRSTLFWKGMSAMVEPGENVGLLAAQSIGEPSTQMTLNTFHFAGRGEMNVTLGIPRLREILMTSGANISTPMVEVCIRPEATDDQIKAMVREFTPVYLKDVIKSITITENLCLQSDLSTRRYAITLKLRRNSDREPFARHLRREAILRRIERNVASLIGDQLSRNYRDTLELEMIQHHKLRQTNQFILKKKGEDETDDVDNRVTEEEPRRPHDDDESSDEEAVGGAEADAAEQRLNQRHRDDAAEYEGEEEDKENVADAKEEDDIMEVEEADSEDDQPNTSANAVDAKDRISAVVRAHKQICDYQYDTKSHRWCTIVFDLPMKTTTKLNVSGIAKRVIDRAVVWQTKDIDKCVIREDVRNGQTARIFQTQKINIEALYKHCHVLDLNTLYSNDVNMMLNHYGIEACTRVIVKEMNNVFGVYGIEVNPRHLTLVADHMTNTGSVQPFSRTAMSNNASPLQKMTYETTAAFMRNAVVKADDDRLESPSARIITGQTIRGGTGAFDLFLTEDYANSKY